MNITNQENPKPEEKKYCLPCCSCSGWKMIVCAIAGLSILSGAVHVGYYLGRKSVPPAQILIDNGPVEIEVSPTPEVKSDETKDWKIYRNEKYGFEFRYPKDWTASADKVQSVDYKADHGLLEGADFFVTVNPDGGQTSGQLVEEVKKYQPQADVFDLKFLGFDAVMVSISSGQEMGQYWPSKTIYFEKQGKIYSLTSESYGPKMDYYLTLLDQILSTFKFLE